MTDREMIEEMAKITNFTAFDYRQGTIQSKTIYTAMAEALYEQNYRKIPDGAVVLSEEEWANSITIDVFIEKVKKTCKETAREILNIIDTEIEKGIEYCKDDYRGLLTARVLIQLFCREQYGVDIEE